MAEQKRDSTRNSTLLMQEMDIDTSKAIYFDWDGVIWELVQLLFFIAPGEAGEPVVVEAFYVGSKQSLSAEF